MKIFWISIIALLFSLVGCAPSGYYQKDYVMKDAAWTHENKLTFDINIADTQSHYNTFLLVRHDDNFPTSNIWLKIKVAHADDATNTYEERIELLMMDADGKPLGKSFGDIWEQKKLLSNLPPFKKAGTYTITIEHVMRTNPLEGVMNIGLQVEKNVN